MSTTTTSTEPVPPPPAPELPPDLAAGLRRLKLAAIRRAAPEVLQTALQFWKVKPEEVHAVLGDAVYIRSPHLQRRIPIDENGEFWINYRYEQGGFLRRRNLCWTTNSPITPPTDAAWRSASARRCCADPFSPGYENDKC